MLSSRKEEIGFRTQGEVLLLDENRLFIHREGRLAEHMNTDHGRKHKECFECLFLCLMYELQIITI